MVTAAGDGSIGSWARVVLTSLKKEDGTADMKT
jgi:hypothetical protein